MVSEYIAANSHTERGLEHYLKCDGNEFTQNFSYGFLLCSYLYGWRFSKSAKQRTQQNYYHWFF